MKYPKRTIKSILDLETGKEIQSDDFFSKPIEEIFRYRYEFESYIREGHKRYVCYYCKQFIKIRGKRNSKAIFHFAHLKDSNDCPIKTNNSFTKTEIQRIKYNGAKESTLHIELKELIGQSLRKNLQSKGEISEVFIEKVRKDQEISRVWKKPDVSAKYKKYNIVFELQLSTTFLSVINDRQEFYKRNRIFILWVFNHFEDQEDKRKFTQSDIFYSNNRNGFEFNKEAQRLSKKRDDLILNCFYEKPIINDEWEIEYVWNNEFVSLSQLTFNIENYKVYFYDVETEKDKLLLEIEKRKRNFEISHSIVIKAINDGDLNELFEIFSFRTLTNNEYRFLENKYKVEISHKQRIESDSPDFLVIWALILYKLGKRNLVGEVLKDYSLRKLIIDILSLKTKKIIGYNFKKHIQIAHLLLQVHPEYKDYYLKAINKWKTINLNKEKKLLDKISRIDKQQIKQVENSKVIDYLFPELL